MSWRTKSERSWGRLGMKYKLSDICFYAKGKVDVSGLTDADYISTENMLSNKGGITTASSLPSTVQTQAYKKDDVLVSNIRPYFKKIWFADFDGGCSNDVLVFRAKEDTDARFLYYVLANDAFFDYSTATSKGTKMPRGDKTAIMQYEVPHFDLPIQKKIAGILADIDDKIALNSNINKNLLEQALAIYKDWFCDYALSDGTLPENWKITTIDAISSLVTRGIAPKYDDSSDQIVLNQKCIRDHTIDISLARRHLPKNINEKWISKGDLLINSTGTGTLGRVAQVWFKANNMTVDSHVTIVRPKDSILQSYIGFWGLSHESEIEAQHTGSTGQTELPRDRVKAIELPLPDEDTLSKFNELVIPMISTVISNQEENARLSQLRDALLPKLMSGELDVSDIDL